MGMKLKSPNPTRLFLNDSVLAVVDSIPLGGGYLWEIGSNDDGVTQDLFYLNSRVAKTNGTSYCCGLTFEIYLRACLNYAQENGAVSFTLRGVDDLEIIKLKRDWYVASGLLGGAVDALVPRVLGVTIPYKDSIAGDFVQFWRKSRSGHSAIVKDAGEDGLTYFSTQPATDGIGTRTEKFTGGNPITETCIVRAFVPELVKKLT